MKRITEFVKTAFYKRQIIVPEVFSFVICLIVKEKLPRHEFLDLKYLVWTKCEKFYIYYVCGARNEG